MSNSPVTKVAVVGSGTMGSQICQLFAVHGIDVNLTDVQADKLEWAVTNIRNNLDQYFVKKDKMTVEQAQATVDRIHPIADFGQALADRELAVEAVYEDLRVKQELFRQLDQLCPPAAILASNTSGVSLAGIAEATQRPGQVAGLHFFNPVAVMKLVEVVQSEQTASSTVDLLCQVATYVGKTPIVCADVPAFVANRCYEALLREALWLVFEGVASPQAVDTAMKLGYNFRIGPMELQDQIGTWGLLLHQPEQRFLPVLTPKAKSRLRHMLSLRYLGRYAESVGKGVYDYYNEYMAAEAQA